MKGIHCTAIIFTALLLASCINKQGGSCKYLAFEEVFEIATLQQDLVATTGSAIENFDIRSFDEAPAIGDRYHVQGRKLIRGSCTPIIELQLTKKQ